MAAHPSRARLVELVVGDEPAAWERAGFASVDGLVRIGEVAVRPVGTAEGRGILRWRVSGMTVTDGNVDGLETEVVEPPEPNAADDEAVRTRRPHSPAHRNGCVGLDHVVVMTPHLDRTFDALAATGLDLRRVRDATGPGGAEIRQGFFRLGPTILEVVGPREPDATQPGGATWFGIAVDVDDLDRTAAHLGDGLGPIKQAVQPGRRIATVRHRSLDISVSIAAMDDRGTQAPPMDHSDEQGSGPASGS